MVSVLANRTYRHLFAAQALSLIGTGLTTVALGLLAYDLAGADAGAVLGTALALKMIAYVGIAPLAGAFASRLPRRGFLVALDLCRASLVLLLPFVTEIWQIYVLVFLFQAFSAAFTPTFQATIPDVLPEERDYTNALSAQFALSHACWLVSYPAAGWLGASLGLDVTFVIMAGGAGAGAMIAAWLWPHYDPEKLPHKHSELVHEHAHVHDAHHQHHEDGETKPHRHLHRHARLATPTPSSSTTTTRYGRADEGGYARRARQACRGKCRLC